MREGKGKRGRDSLYACKPGVEEDDFIWGGTEEIVDRPRGCKARVQEGDVLPLT